MSFLAALRTPALARTVAAARTAPALRSFAATAAARNETAAQEDAQKTEESVSDKEKALAEQVDKLTAQLKEKDVKISDLTVWIMADRNDERHSLREQTVASPIDHYRRTLADLENMRERTKRDVEHAHQFAVQKFAKDLLSISDVLALALDSVKAEALEANADLKNLHEGLTLTSNELHKTFHRHGVQRIDAVEGDKFDHNLHQAIFQAPVPGREPGTILQVAKSGYTLNGRVLRPTHVGVVQETE
ncbi:Mitochondrial matrix cochaperone [Allomyces javanicus]|nr:Mitochondrial matrix cochaperone [Allomyces javanicus]